jgi:hypothetical protein
MVKRMYVIEEKKDRSGWWVILVAAFFVAYWNIVLIIGISMLVAYLLVQCYRWNKTRQAQKKAEAANAWMDAPTQLLTEGMRVWGNPEHYVHDYDDGMRHWR